MLLCGHTLWYIYGFVGTHSIYDFVGTHCDIYMTLWAHTVYMTLWAHTVIYIYDFVGTHCIYDFYWANIVIYIWLCGHTLYIYMTMWAHTFGICIYFHTNIHIYHWCNQAPGNSGLRSRIICLNIVYSDSFLDWSFIARYFI